MLVIGDPQAVPSANPVGVLLRDLVHERTGIFFETSRIPLMLDKLQPLAQAVGQSLIGFYYDLKYGERTGGEWTRVADELSVQETYFWREMSQIDALVKVLVPRWFNAGHGLLRIWSAACATGEEPYTIALALEEAGWGQHPIQIVATDASTRALAKAQAGVFRERSFRALPPALRAKYFVEVENGWRLDRQLAARVTFRRANLVQRLEIEELAVAPVIFCRNVFIYFSPDAIRRTVAVLAEGMPAGGHLFVGVSESLLKLTNQFTLEEIGDAFVYVRKAGEKA